MSKRQAVESYVYKFCDTADPSGYNSKIYRERFGGMSDKQFELYMTALKDGRDQLRLYAPPQKVVLTTNDLLAACDMVGVEIFERLNMWDSVNGRWMKTSAKYAIVELYIRRLRQHVDHAISVPESDTVTSLQSGQVTGPDKGSSISMVETAAIVNRGLTKSAVELMQVRGGSPVYADFRAQLEEEGQVSLGNLDPDARPRASVILGVYLNAIGLEHNIIGE